MSTVRWMLASLAEVLEVTAFSMEIRLKILGLLVQGNYLVLALRRSKVTTVLV